MPVNEPKFGGNLRMRIRGSIVSLEVESNIFLISFLSFYNEIGLNLVKFVIA